MQKMLRFLQKTPRHVRQLTLAIRTTHSPSASLGYFQICSCWTYGLDFLYTYVYVAIQYPRSIALSLSPLL